MGFGSEIPAPALFILVQVHKQPQTRQDIQDLQGFGALSDFRLITTAFSIFFLSCIVASTAHAAAIAPVPSLLLRTGCGIVL